MPGFVAFFHRVSPILSILFWASLYYDSLFRNGIYSQILFLQAMARTFFNCRTICFALYVFLLKVILLFEKEHSFFQCSQFQ